MRRTLASAALVALALGAGGCVPPDPPCVAHQTLDDVSWIPPAELDPQLDAMNAAVADAPENGAPPSTKFATAERDLKVEFWADAAQGMLAVARGDTKDDRVTRKMAQYHLGVALYRLKYYTEARMIFHTVAKTEKHPAQASADKWLEKKYCEKK